MTSSPDLLEVGCPICWAIPGAKCRRLFGDRPHLTRITEAARSQPLHEPRPA